MIPELGHFALVIALALGAAQSFFALYGAALTAASAGAPFFCVSFEPRPLGSACKRLSPPLVVLIAFPVLPLRASGRFRAAFGAVFTCILHSARPLRSNIELNPIRCVSNLIR